MAAPPPIYIAAYRGVSIVSKLIRWQSRSQYSHVGILFEDRTVIESWHIGGVQHNASLSTVHTPGTLVDIFALRHPLTLQQHRKLYAFLLHQLGKRYDFRMVLRFLSRRRQSCDCEDKWFCSELIFEAFAVAEILLLANTEAWRVPPDWIPRSPLLNYLRTVVTSEKG